MDRRVATGVAVGIAATACCSLLVWAITPTVPVDAAGVVYLVGVLLVSVRYGLGPALATAGLSALAYNFFFLPPRHSLVVHSTGDALGLAVYVATAVVASHLATASRRQAEEARQRAWEAQLGRELATAAAASPTVERALPALARHAARALGAEDGVIHLGSESPDVRLDRTLPLVADGRRVGEMRLMGRVRGASLESPAAAGASEMLASLILLAEQRDRVVAADVETQTLRRSDDLKTALLRGVSHDLRSPLQAITTAAGALRLGAADPGQAELADAVLEQAERMDRLIGDLLDLSRLQSGAVSPSADWCDVEDLIEGSLRELGPEVVGRVKVQLDPQLPLVRADPGHIERVLANLIDNAAKFSPPEQPVEVTGRPLSGRVEIGVTDHGPGIAGEELERIFEPFHRARGTATAPGSGLGLAVARGLARANGAQLTATSTPGHGSQFVLRIAADRNRAAR